MKIIPDKSNAGKLCISNGTKVITEDGSEIWGIRKISVVFEVDKFVEAEAEFYCSMDEIDGVILSAKMAHPLTGEFKDVSSVTFADGETVDLCKL